MEGARFKVQFYEVNGTTFAHLLAKPGWKWSEDIKPLVKTELCKNAHTMFILRGKLAAQLGDKESRPLSLDKILILQLTLNRWWKRGRERPSFLLITTLGLLATKKWKPLKSPSHINCCLSTFCSDPLVNFFLQEPTRSKINNLEANTLSKSNKLYSIRFLFTTM